MKKLLALIIIFATLLSTAGCNTESGGGRSHSSNESDNNTQTVYLVTKLTTFYENSDKIFSTTSYEYDDNNMLVQKVVTLLDRSPDFYTYEYDDNYNLIHTRENGQITETYQYDEYNRRISDSNNTIYIYNDDNSKQIDAYGTKVNDEIIIEGSFEYEYDNRNNIILQKRYNQDYKLDSSVQYMYDDRSNLITHNEYDQNNTLIFSKTYKYDESDNMIEYKHYANEKQLASDIPTFHFSYVYNDDNLLVEKILYESGNPRYVYGYEYEDDTLWVSRYYYPKGTTPIEKTMYEFKMVEIQADFRDKIHTELINDMELYNFGD